MNLNKLLKVVILKMNESSGNEMFFVRLAKVKDDKVCMFGSDILEIACWQTKDLSKEECLERAWFDASDVAIFLGHEDMEQVHIANMSDEEILLMKDNITSF